MTRRLTPVRGPMCLLVWLTSAVIVLAGCGTVDSTFGTRTPESQRGADPSGSILFVAGGNVQLWHNGDTQQLTKGFIAKSPSWSHNGDRFAYVQMSDGFSDLYIADRNGKQLYQLTHDEPADQPYSEDWAFNAAWALEPVWSPVADEIAFISDKGGQDPYSDPLSLWYAEKWDKSVDPYPLPAAVSIAETQEWPTFSPDGNKLAFVVRTGNAGELRWTDIWTVELNGGATAKLVTGSESAFEPAWSPDGANIAYIQRTATADDVWIVPTDGSSRPYQLTQIGACVAPVWSPDGHFLAFFRENNGNFEAWYVEVTPDPSGRLNASAPQKLFSVDNIDAQSGMSWSGS